MVLLLIQRLLLLCLALLAAEAASSNNNNKVIEKSWTLSHSNGVDPPTKRATIRLKINDDEVELTIENVENTSSASIASLLKESPKFYQLILKDNNDKNAPVIKTSVLACQLLRANLR